MNRPFRRIALIARKFDGVPPIEFRAFIGWLRGHGFEVALDETSAEAGGESGGLPREEVCREADLVIVLGGDGSMLSASHHLQNHSTALLGINTGFLGFLADIPRADLYPALERILLEGEYTLEERMQLRTTVCKNGKTLQLQDALNDVVITSGPLARMVGYQVAVDGRDLGTFRADGLILATPTGSTAYSLSAGGPLVMPDLNVIIVCPICPHALSNRPIVLPEDKCVEVELFPDDEAPNRRLLLTLDGGTGCELEPGDRVTVKRSPEAVRLVRPKNTDFFQILRDKLSWETLPRGNPAS